MKRIALLLWLCSAAWANAEVVIEGLYGTTLSTTGNYVYDPRNPTLDPPTPAQASGGVVFTTGPTGHGEPAYPWTWRVNSIQFNFNTQSDGSGGFQTYTLGSGSSVSLYKVSGGNLSYVANTAAIAFTDTSGTSISTISGNGQNVRVNFTNWSQLSGQIFSENTQYLLGLNLVGNSTGYLNMNYESSSNNGFKTPATGWVIGETYNNFNDTDFGYYTSTTTMGDLDNTVPGSSRRVEYTLNMTAVPEPETFVLYGLALALMGGLAWRRHRGRRAVLAPGVA